MGPRPPLTRGRHWMNKFGRPLIASVPTLVGVIVGALASHFAELNRIDFEREERFRHEQIERVVKLSHALNGFYDATAALVSNAASSQRFLCGFANEFAPLQDKLLKAGVLKHKFIGDKSVHPAQEFDELIAAEIANEGPYKADAQKIQALKAGFISVLSNQIDKNTAFFAQRDTLANDEIFDVQVYFPDQKKNVVAIADTYDAIAANASSATTSLDAMCATQFPPLQSRLEDTHARSMSLTITLARSIDPDITSR